MMWQSSSRHLSSEKITKNENTTYATKLDQKHNM